MSDPSPWISAIEFNEFWSEKVYVETYSASYILNNINEIYNRPFYRGDVVQMLKKIFWGGVGDAYHTMYITNYDIYNDDDVNSIYEGNQFFELTYHSIEREDNNLLAIVENNPDYYYRFFTIN